MKAAQAFFRDFNPWLQIVAICLLTVATAPAQTPTPETPAAVAAAAASSPEIAASPVERGRVLYPANGAQASPAVARSGGEPAGISSLSMSFLMLLALCAAGYYFLRRQSGFTPAGKGQRKLVVSESRSLGNRQFLVVVEYENERVLIGVTPGKIDYLCPLPTVGTAGVAVFKERVT